MPCQFGLFLQPREKWMIGKHESSGSAVVQAPGAWRAVCRGGVRSGKSGSAEWRAGALSQIPIGATNLGHGVDGQHSQAEERGSDQPTFGGVAEGNHGLVDDDGSGNGDGWSGGGVRISQGRRGGCGVGNGNRGLRKGRDVGAIIEFGVDDFLSRGHVGQEQCGSESDHDSLRPKNVLNFHGNLFAFSVVQQRRHRKQVSDQSGVVNEDVPKKFLSA
jgi:hypothetical protein